MRHNEVSYSKSSFVELCLASSLNFLQLTFPFYFLDYFLSFILYLLQENHNAELSSKVHYMVDKNLLDDPHVKANLLFQVVATLF